MTKRHLILSFPAVLLLSLAACSTEAPKEPEAKKAAEPEKPPEPVSAQKAYYQIFPMARAWAPDLEILQMADMRVQGVKGGAGTAAAWQVVFVSPSKGKMRQFVYSTVKADGLEKGASPTREETYSPRGQAKPFRVAAFKIDSTAAYKTAADHSADYMKKHPDIPVTFLLESTPQFPNPAWRVIWGDSVATSGYSIYVDATTGAYLKTMR